MKASELRSLPVAELQIKLDDALDELANLRIQKATHQLVNPSRVRMVKKEISRIRTLLREYELQISKPTLDQNE